MADDLHELKTPPVLYGPHVQDVFGAFIDFLVCGLPSAAVTALDLFIRYFLGHRHPGHMKPWNSAEYCIESFLHNPWAWAQGWFQLDAQQVGRALVASTHCTLAVLGTLVFQLCGLAIGGVMSCAAVGLSLGIRGADHAV